MRTIQPIGAHGAPYALAGNHENSGRFNMNMAHDANQAFSMNCPMAIKRK
jgi:hypothetical protein